MIRFSNVGFTYSESPSPTLSGVDLASAKASSASCRPTGSGKSTLLGLMNGLVPHFSGGHVTGEVRIDGRSIRDHPPESSPTSWRGRPEPGCELRHRCG